MKRVVEVLPPNPAWPDLFAAEAFAVKAALPAVTSELLHIGSTAVPGMPAKPIIDLMAATTDLTTMDRQAHVLSALGYTAMGEFGVPGRRYFWKGLPRHSHHLHVFQEDSPHIIEHLAFRDHLRAHPADAERYANLKHALAKQFTFDPAGYTAAKSAFIRSVLEQYR